MKFDIIKKYIKNTIYKNLIYTIVKLVLILVYLMLNKDDAIIHKDGFYNLLLKIIIKNNYIVINKQILNSKPINKGMIIISNHVNIYDFIFIRNVIDCYVVGNDVFLINKKVEENLEIISYKILNKKSGTNVKKNILKLINSGKNVLVFPEGRMCNSLKDNLLKFKKGLFHLAYDNNIPILMTFLYSNNNNFAIGHPIHSIKVILKFLFNVFLFNNSTTVVTYELIDFVYRNNFNNFNDYYNYITTKMIKTLDKYRK
jgi:1-acyl-sn-glycerol-3-phosphate acyltransferase